MVYDAMIVAAHPDDAEVQMGGTIAKLTGQGPTVLIVDLCNGEPTGYAEPHVRAEQAYRAARILGADRLIMDQQGRLIQDTIPLRLAVAKLIRQHQPVQGKNSIRAPTTLSGSLTIVVVKYASQNFTPTNCSLRGAG